MRFWPVRIVLLNLVLLLLTFPGAGDLRAHDLSDQDAMSWYQATKDELEPLGFDVVWEGGVGATPATTGAHMHIEFDPKDRKFWHNA